MQVDFTAEIAEGAEKEDRRGMGCPELCSFGVEYSHVINLWLSLCVLCDLCGSIAGFRFYCRLGK
jgi:hypothetical protein